MLFDGISLVRGTDAENFAIGARTVLPETGEDGEMLLLTTGQCGIYVRHAGRWAKLLDDTNAENALITVTGEVIGSGRNDIELTIADSGVASGTYGSECAIPRIIVADDGRLTLAENKQVMLDAATIVSGAFDDSRISESSVTQFQGNLSIKEDQIENGNLLARSNDNENITGRWSFLTSPAVPYAQFDNDVISKAFLVNYIAPLISRIEALEAEVTALKNS
jgi:hypothetical protein